MKEENSKYDSKHEKSTEALKNKHKEISKKVECKNKYWKIGKKRLH
jgi:hypothetical protein